jgi:hypothetical protein
MPFLRLYADALSVRLLNPTTRWEPNDLIDMLYFACAAAHADGVAAERTASRYLNARMVGSAGSVPRGADPGRTRFAPDRPGT